MNMKSSTKHMSNIIDLTCHLLCYFENIKMYC